MDEHWDDWRVVHTAWQTGSFTAAAAELGIGQATVSRRVAAVEERLGQALFDRHRSGLVPTAAAHDLKPQLEALMAAGHGLARALDGFEVEAVGVVSVAAAPGVCVDLLPVLAMRVAATHPRVTLEALADVRAHDLDRREADLALRVMPTTHGDLVVRRIATIASGLFAHPCLVERLPREATADQVPLVQWGGAYIDIPMAEVTRQLGGPIRFRSDSYLALRAAAQQGLGACLMSVLEAETMGLVRVPIAFEVPDMPLFLVVHRSLRQVPRVAAVIDAIDSWAQEIRTR